MIRGTKHSLKSHMGEGPSPVLRLPAEEATVSLTINNRVITVPKGTTILQAALHHDIDIPYFCYHPGLSPEGNCRMCLVELVGRPKLEPSCIMPVAEGMVVNTESAAVQEARKGVMEFLLLNHPLDCPWCDKAGECMLQDNSYDHGPGTTRHRLEKRTYPVKDFSPVLKMYMNRCIHCTRCVRFLKEIEGKEEFSLYQRGAYVDVGTYLEHNLSNNYQGCLSDVCPVGALISKPALYTARVFDMEAQAGVCAGCSTGCSIYVDRWRNRVARLRSRPNLQVNEWWMCDTGRYGWQWIEHDRLEGQEPEEWESATTAACQALIDPGKGFRRTAGIVAPTATCEEIYLFRKLMAGLNGPVAAWYGSEGRIDPTLKNDFLHRQDANPNTVGMEAVIDGLEDLGSLLGRIEAGEFEAVVVLAAGLDEASANRLTGAGSVIAISSHRNPVVDVATHSLPGSVWLEKSGTFVNGDGHLQLFRKALDGDAGIRPDWQILSDLLAGCGLCDPYPSVEAAFGDMAQEILPFFGLTHATIPGSGVGLAQRIKEAEKP